MTADTRFERDLTALLEDLYLGPSPAYRHEALDALRRTRQRPAWAFPGRWLPMADIASRPTLAPPVQWRTVGLGLLVIALLLATIAVVVGSRQTRLPAPFGVAANGLIAFASEGDILATDPETGRVTSLVTGPDVDVDPAFSPDGTRLAFGRLVTGQDPARLDIVVARADGSEQRVVTPAAMTADDLRFQWAPDSRSILADEPGGVVRLYDAATTGEGRILATDLEPYPNAFRPPDGAQLLGRAGGPGGDRMVVIDIASGGETLLAERLAENDLGAAAWSPDGRQVVYMATPAGDDLASQRLFIVNADGTGRRQITDEPGVWFHIDPVWSPDGSRIAFTRYERTGRDAWDIRPIGIYTLADGSVSEVGPLPRDLRTQYPSAGDEPASAGEGFFLQWSPDGTMLYALVSEGIGYPILIDAGSGDWQRLGPVSEPGTPVGAWQRLPQP